MLHKARIFEAAETAFRPRLVFEGVGVFLGDYPFNLPCGVLSLRAKRSNPVKSLFLCPLLLG
jgi:hypothetical protein